jgi:hypothetical protein
MVGGTRRREPDQGKHDPFLTLLELCTGLGPDGNASMGNLRWGLCWLFAFGRNVSWGVGDALGDHYAVVYSNRSRMMSFTLGGILTARFDTRTQTGTH